MAKKSKARFIKPAEHRQRWNEATEDQRLNDPTWYLNDLDDVQKQVLEAPTVLGLNLRLGEPVPVKMVMNLVRQVHGVEMGQVHSALSRLEQGRLIFVEQGEFRLARRIDQHGIRDTRQKLKRTHPSKKIVSATRQYGKRCVYCNKPFPTTKLTVDHVWPRFKGGKNTGNMVPCCEHCNQSKRDRSPEQWARDILQWNRRRRTKPRHYTVAWLAVAPAFVLSWMVATLSFVKGSFR